MEKTNPSELSGADFLRWYFRNNGITENEIRLCTEWGIFDNCRNTRNNEEGRAYAAGMTAKIKRYRGLTVDDLRKDYNDAPWAWPSAMRFQKVLWKSVRDILVIPGRPPILMCYYGGKQYFFNVGKEEPFGEALDKMIDEGEWYTYTYCD